METNDRLSTASDIKVIPIRVNRPATVEGIVRRLVWKVEKLSNINITPTGINNRRT